MNLLNNNMEKKKFEKKRNKRNKKGKQYVSYTKFQDEISDRTAVYSNSK